jgi:hypothetical protein
MRNFQKLEILVFLALGENGRISIRCAFVRTKWLPAHPAYLPSQAKRIISLIFFKTICKASYESTYIGKVKAVWTPPS